MLYVAIVVATAALYFLLIFPTKWVKIERVHHHSGLGIRALQISDLHVEKIRIGTKQLYQMIEAEQPDYIFLTGDYTEKASYLPKVKQYLEAITSYGVPTFAVLGNHDHRLKPEAMKQLLHIMQDTGVQYLNNESAETADFVIVGIDDLGSGKSNSEQAFQYVDASKQIIVLTHDPNLVLQLDKPYSYLMAGHFHGMQFHLPFLFPFIRKKGKLVRMGIIKGTHQHENGTFYISKGISQAGPNARFLIRSEITVHEL